MEVARVNPGLREWRREGEIRLHSLCFIREKKEKLSEAVCPLLWTTPTGECRNSWSLRSAAAVLHYSKCFDDNVSFTALDIFKNFSFCEIIFLIMIHLFVIIHFIFYMDLGNIITTMVRKKKMILLADDGSLCLTAGRVVLIGLQAWCQTWRGSLRASSSETRTLSSSYCTATTYRSLSVAMTTESVCN